MCACVIGIICFFVLGGIPTLGTLRESVEFYEGDSGLPVFKRLPVGTKRVFTVEQIVEALLDPNLKDSGKVCHKLPVSISHNVVFVIDVSQLDDPNDVNCDDLGVWKNNRVDAVFFHASISDLGVADIEKCSSGAEAAYQLKRVYRYHGTNPSLLQLLVSYHSKML